ncbi:MAG: hypothetical protein V7750_18700 [Sneathiella sp.]
MFQNPSLVKRIAIGKGIGFSVGVLGVACLFLFAPESSPLLLWGVVLWYTTVGAFVGIFGLFTEHPVFKFSFPWWLRSSFLGAWMNFVLTFFAYDVFQALLLDVFGDFGALISPFWFVLEGAIVGLLIGYFATRYGGEGESLPVVAD